MHLTDRQVADFRRDGCVFPIRVLSAAEAAGYRARLEAYESATGAPIHGNLRHKTHLLFTWADELVHHPAILDAVADVIGPDILCWTTNFFIKEPSSAGFVSWHQDSTYWGLDPADVVTAWVAFTDATPENGYMQFIPGTHTGRPAAAPRHLPSRQPALARPGDRGRGRQEQGGRHRPAGGRDVDPSHQAGARLRAEPQRRPADRLRDPLHPDLRAPDQGPRLGDAGARHRQVPPLRPRAAAAGRHGRRRRWPPMPRRWIVR